jgi:hypothetical protein
VLSLVLHRAHRLSQSKVFATRQSGRWDRGAVDCLLWRGQRLAGDGVRSRVSRQIILGRNQIIDPLLDKSRLHGRVCESSGSW